MGVVIRGVKNAFRNTIRTMSITFILALSIAMSLVMLLALKTVEGKISEVKGSIGNTITVSPAGMRGFEGGGTLLTTQNVNDLKSLSHVSNVIATLSGRLTTIGTDTSKNPFGRNDENDANATTSLTAPPLKVPQGEAGSSGGRQQRVFINGKSVTDSNFSMPISVTGINDLSNLSALNVSSLTMTSGEKIDPTSAENVAMLGQDLASQNNLAAGGTFTAYGQTITVKGIYDSGTAFTNGFIIMPLTTLQKLSGQTDEINTAIVNVDSVDSLANVESEIKAKLGENVDVVSSAESTKNAVTPLQNIRTISLYSLIGSVAAGSIIILLTMIMIVRERRREIGVLKAIGSSNLKIMMQFISEAMSLTMIASIVGIVLGFIFSNPVLKVLIDNSGDAATTTVENIGKGGPGGAMMRFGGRALGGVQANLRDLHAVVGWEIILYGILAAIVIAIIGSAIPAFFIAKVRPAEAMRAE